MSAAAHPAGAERSSSGLHASSSRGGGGPRPAGALAPRRAPPPRARGPARLPRPAHAARARGPAPARSARDARGAPGPRPGEAPLDPGVPARLLPTVEAAMLAAFSGMAYTLFSTVGLDKYVGYFLPLPAVLASARQGAPGALRVVAATVALLALLQGPLRAAAFLSTHGVLAAALGCAWALRLRWAVLVPAVASARVVGMLSYLALSGWVMRADLIQLAVTNGEPRAPERGRGPPGRRRRAAAAAPLSLPPHPAPPPPPPPPPRAAPVPASIVARRPRAQRRGGHRGG